MPFNGSGLPPSGSSRTRRHAQIKNRLRNPLASSTVVVCRASSVLVMWPMIAMCALVAVAGASSEQRERPAVPRGPECRGQRRDLSARGFQDGRELGFDDEQPLVVRAGVLVLGVADGPDQPLAAGEAGRHARGEAGVRVGQQAGDVIERAALSRFRGVADEEHELVGMVLGGFVLEERLVADHRAARDQQLGEDRDRVRLGVRRELLDDRAGQPVIGGRVRRRRPPVRRPGVPASAWTAPWSFGRLGERGASGFLVADRAVGDIGGDQRLGREVVHLPGEAARELVDQPDRVV